MKKIIIFTLAMVLLFGNSLSPTYAFTLNLTTPTLQTPTLTLGPSVVATYPAAHERVLVSVRDSMDKLLPRITVLFSEPVTALTNAKNAITITSDDGVTTSRDFYTAEIVGNALYIEVSRWTVNQEFSITIDGSQIKSTKTGYTLGNNYSWSFTTDKTRYSNVERQEENEPVPELRLTKQSLVKDVEITNNADTLATYRISVVPYGVTSLRNITIIDVLPPGFTFDSIVGGNVNNGSSVHAAGNNQITFSIDSALTGGDTLYFDYRVKLSGQVNNGRPIIPAGTYHNAAIAKGYFTPTASAQSAYGNNNFRSVASDSREDRDNIVVTRQTTILSTPTINATPSISSTSNMMPTVNASATPLSSNTPSASSSVSQPENDALPCLQVRGAETIPFTDLNDAASETPFIDFLNTTTFISSPETRLVKGYSNNSFGPNNTLTRFELTKIALGANCITYLKDPTPNSFFSDVPKDTSEISLVIGKAYAEGIVKGIGDKFYPNRPVTYGEMVKILLGAGIYFERGQAKASLNPNLNGLNDESFRQFAEYAAAMRLVDLRANNTFPQDENVQRKSMAKAGAKYVAWFKKVELF